MSGIINRPGAQSGIIGGAGQIGYEEGTWTPVITRTTTNASGTPSVLGHYTKIGNICYVSIYAQLNGYSGGSGQWQVSLPFTSRPGVHTQGLYNGRVYMSGDSADREFRIPENTKLAKLHTPSNDGAFTSDISYLIWYVNGVYEIAGTE